LILAISGGKDDAQFHIVGVWKKNDISYDLEKQLVQPLIWSIALYMSESCALKKRDEKTERKPRNGYWKRLRPYIRKQGSLGAGTSYPSYPMGMVGPRAPGSPQATNI